MDSSVQDLVEALTRQGAQITGDTQSQQLFGQLRWRSDSDSGSQTPGTLYICDGNPGTALYLGRTSLQLPHTSPEQCYELLSAFLAQYDEWQNALVAAVLSECDVHTFLTLAGQPFGCPLLFTDTNGNLLETSRTHPETLEQIHTFLQVAPSLSALRHTIRDNLTDFPDSRPEAVQHVLCSAIWLGSQHVGDLYFYHYAGAVHEGVLLRIAEVTKLLSCLLTVNPDAYLAVSYVAGVLPDVVHGRFENWDRLIAEFRAIGWHRSHVLRLAAFGQAEDPDVFAELQTILRSRGLACYSFTEAGQLILLGNETLTPELFTQILNFIRRLDLPLSAGLSAPFHGIQQFPIYCRQAQFALRLALARQISVQYAADAGALALWKDLSESGTLQNWVHPDWETLRRCDEQHRTSLFQTLAAYLACGCRFDCAAERLHVHPNTIRYRIQKAEPLLSGSLYDPAYREELLLSLFLLPLPEAPLEWI